MNVKFCRSLTLAAVCCLVSARAFAAPAIDPRARLLVDDMSALYRHALSYSDTTTLATTGEGLVSASTMAKLNFHASISWVWPDKVAAIKTAANGDVSRVVSDGDTLWAVTPQHKGVYLKQSAVGYSIFDSLGPIDTGSPGLGIMLDGQGVDSMIDQGLTSLKLGEASSFQGVAVQLVIGNIDIPSGGTATETFLIGTGDGLLRRMTMDCTMGQGHLQIVETHSKIKINPVIPVSIFNFTSPAGAKIVAN